MLSSKRGISPLIAAVLLVAFTVAVGVILMGWVQKYTKTEQKAVGAYTKKGIECTWGSLKIKCVVFAPAENKFFAIVENTGVIPLWDLRMVVYSLEGIPTTECFIDSEKGALTDFGAIYTREGDVLCTPRTPNSTDCYGIKEGSVTTIFADLASCKVGDLSFSDVSSVQILTSCPTNVRPSTRECAVDCLVTDVKQCEIGA